jgi:predicted dehydrogenase
MMADKIRLGLIGASVTGTWSARSHLPAVLASPDVELTAVCTTKAASAEAARQAYGARLGFDDYRKMIASPEIDAVAVVVRVPSHYAPTKTALEAGRHVYCEWPLGRTTAEAAELAALAKANRLVTAVGLQARVNPALMYLKEQVEAGYVGEVMAIHISLLREGVLSRPSHRTWQRDVELGANTLTIAAGHTVDAMRFVAGDFDRLSAVVATQAKQWLDTGTGALLDATSPDNVLLSGRLTSGAVASVHVAAIPFAGSGYRMEIYGREGTLVVAGEDSPQLSRVVLQGAKRGNELAQLPIPALNVGHGRHTVRRSLQRRPDVHAVRARHPKWREPPADIRDRARTAPTDRCDPTGVRRWPRGDLRIGQEATASIPVSVGRTDRRDRACGPAPAIPARSRGPARPACGQHRRHRRGSG